MTTFISNQGKTHENKYFSFNTLLNTHVSHANPINIPIHINNIQ